MRNIFMMIALNSSITFLLLSAIYGFMKSEIENSKTFKRIMDAVMGLLLFAGIVGFIVFINIVIIDLIK